MKLKMGALARPFQKGSKFNWKLILIIALCIMFFSFIKGAINNLLVAVGLKKKPDDEAYDKYVEQNRIAVLKGATTSAVDQYKKQSPSYPDYMYVSKSQSLYDDLKYTSTWDNEPDDAMNILKTMQNDSDILKLIAAMGEVYTYSFGIFPSGPYTLQSLVDKQLSTQHVSELNSYYRSHSIKFQF